MAGTAPDYDRGAMDIQEQTRTYHSFLVLSKWGSLVLGVGLLFFVLLFAVGVGFIASAASALVMLVLGIVLLKDKRKSAH